MSVGEDRRKDLVKTACVAYRSLLFNEGSRRRRVGETRVRINISKFLGEVCRGGGKDDDRRYWNTRGIHVVGKKKPRREPEEGLLRGSAWCLHARKGCCAENGRKTEKKKPMHQVSESLRFKYLRQDRKKRSRMTATFERNLAKKGEIGGKEKVKKGCRAGAGKGRQMWRKIGNSRRLVGRAFVSEGGTEGGGHNYKKLIRDLFRPGPPTEREADHIVPLFYSKMMHKGDARQRRTKGGDSIFTKTRA